MLKFILYFAAIAWMVGCGVQKSPKVAQYTNDGIYREECAGGVVYYEWGNALAPAYKQDGSLYLC